MEFTGRYSTSEVQLTRIWDEIQSNEQKKLFLLGILVTATTLNDMAMLDVWLPKALLILGAEAVEETILQTLLFAGFPKTIEALKQLRMHVQSTGKHKHVEDHKQAGENTSKIVYGEYHARLKEVMDGLHPDLTRWMIEDGYGRVLSRSGLSLVEREIGVLGSLMASGMLHQYRAHLRGALFAGAEKVDIIWFTNTFQCIIAAELRDSFNTVTQEMLDL